VIFQVTTDLTSISLENLGQNHSAGLLPNSPQNGEIIHVSNYFSIVNIGLIYYAAKHKYTILK
jgi:hypothetical protein